MTLAAGWFLTRALTAGAWNGPRWATLLMELSLGALFGPGVASVLYFAMVAAGVANRASEIGLLAVLLGGSAGLWWRLTPRWRLTPLPSAQENAPQNARPLKFPWTWVLWIGVALGVIFFFLDFQAASSANPMGEWDAMSIWNLRAHYLASGSDFWRRAVSSDIGGHMTGSTHPGYPLFLSGFIALQWSAARGLGAGFDQIVPYRRIVPVCRRKPGSIGCESGEPKIARPGAAGMAGVAGL